MIVTFYVAADALVKPWTPGLIQHSHIQAFLFPLVIKLLPLMIFLDTVSLSVWIFIFVVPVKSLIVQPLSRMLSCHLLLHSKLLNAKAISLDHWFALLLCLMHLVFQTQSCLSPVLFLNLIDHALLTLKLLLEVKGFLRVNLTLIKFCAIGISLRLCPWDCDSICVEGRVTEIQLREKKVRQ